MTYRGLDSHVRARADALRAEAAELTTCLTAVAALAQKPAPLACGCCSTCQALPGHQHPDHHPVFGHQHRESA